VERAIEKSIFFEPSPRDHGAASERIQRCYARHFNVAASNQAGAGDITYIATVEGWLFLAMVIDLFSRPDRTVG
jgi:transposase InsO family protein